MGLKTMENQPNSPDYYIEDTPILDEEIPDFEEEVNSDLHDLKSRHEKLVDTILKEEDDLISSHHNFIESTITSGILNI